MASYRAAEERLLADVTELHDYLWGGRRPDEAKLLARLRRDARALDGHLGTRGRVERGIRPMVRHFRKATDGPELFVFLHAAANLSAAADRVRRRPREASRSASEVAVALTIHLAAAAGRRALTEAFETGRTDFATYSSRLADALEERGVLRAGEFRRAANQSFDLHALWDHRVSPETKRIMAQASVADAALACVLFVDAMRALGRYREAPHAQLVPVAERILRRAGGHP